MKKMDPAMLAQAMAAAQSAAGPEPEGAAEAPEAPRAEADEAAMAAGLAADHTHPGVEGSPMHRKAHNMPANKNVPMPPTGY